MPRYVQSHVTKIYPAPANAPEPDKVIFTIDHIHHGGAGLYSTYDVVKFLVGKNIPVTVFLQCTDPLNFCPKERTNAAKIYRLAPHLVSLAPHSLSRGNSQFAQRNNLNLIQNVIADTTGSRSKVMSYHGNGAGPEHGISYAGIQYARGIKTSAATQNLNPLDTPVMGLNSVTSAFNYTRTKNKAGLCAALFVHSAELRNGSRKKRVFDTFIKEVSARRLQAISYYSAMRHDFSSGSSTPSTPSTTPSIPTAPSTPTTPSSTPTTTPNNTPSAPSSPCPPLAHLSSHVLSQNLRKGNRDGRAGISQVAELQRFLNELGLEAGIADGIFGSRTKLSVIGYQILMGLTADGIVGPNTRASINAFCS